MDDFINQLTSVVSTWQQAGVVAGLVVLVNLLTNVTKLQMFAKWVPAAARAWIAAGLGSVGGFLAALVAGKPLAQAVMSGLLIGLGAIGTHELVTTARPAVRAMRRKVKLAAKSGSLTLLILVISLPGLTIIGMSCSSTAGQVIKGDVGECAKPEVKNVIEAAIPLALGLIDKLTDQNGAVDWDTFAGHAKASGWSGAVCLFDKAVDEFTKRFLKAGPSSRPHLDPDLQHERAMAARAKAWPQ